MRMTRAVFMGGYQESKPSEIFPLQVEVIDNYAELYSRGGTSAALYLSCAAETFFRD